MDTHDYIWEMALREVVVEREDLSKLFYAHFYSWLDLIGFNSYFEMLTMKLVK